MQLFAFPSILATPHPRAQAMPRRPRSGQPATPQTRRLASATSQVVGVAPAPSGYKRQEILLSPRRIHATPRQGTTESRRGPMSDFGDRVRAFGISLGSAA